MVFSSLTFICVFLPVVFLLYSILPGIKLKNILLIIASLIFYSYGEPVYVLLMIASTFFNWLFGLGCALSNKNFRKLFLIVSIIVNLSILGLFKYADMFIHTLNYFPCFNINLPGLPLPLGISFYTFQALSYVIDVYRGQVKCQRNYFYVLLYISFFPQLVAGPIVKYKDIEKEINDRQCTFEDVSSGIIRFSFGLGKKVLIANTMGGIVDTIYSSNPDEINICVAWMLAVCYLMQIYFDFSAYSDMAIGMAMMFGFHYKENFNYPYCSQSIKDFWRRWHISLSTWFKEYLYIPLGGNRKGKLRTSLNKVFVFFTCGLWHGANWTFVVWGLGHGLFLLIEDFIPIRKLPKPLSWLYSIIVITVLFVIFRSETLNQAFFIIGQMFYGFHFEEPCIILAFQILSLINIVTFIIALCGALNIGNIIYRIFESRISPSVVLVIKCVLSLIILILCLLTLSGGDYNPFIYFRF